MGRSLGAQGSGHSGRGWGKVKVDITTEIGGERCRGGAQGRGRGAEGRWVGLNLLNHSL